MAETTKPAQATSNLRKKDKGSQNKILVASPWQLILWKFLRHRLAVVSLIVVGTLYFLAIFADFFAPYQPNTRYRAYVLAPPQPLHFISEEGFSLRPFVYRMEQRIDLTTGRRIYEPDMSTRYPVYFFVRGEPYRLWGLIPSDLHLFGAEGGGTIFLLGTDLVGRDMLSQIIFGARVSLSIGLVGVTVSIILGLIFGGLSGFYGGTLDNVIQRTIEILRSFPTLALWMALAAALPPHWTQLQIYFAVVVILSLLGWTSLAREVRGKIYSLKNEDFVLAARINGSSTARLIRVHLIPSFSSHIIAVVTLAIPGMILGETSLSFLGIGLSRPIVSWGVLLEQAQNVNALLFAPWLLWPGAFVVITVLAFNFLGDGLRDAADPYSAQS